MDVIKGLFSFRFFTVFLNGVLLHVLLNNKLKARFFYVTYFFIVIIVLKDMLGGLSMNEILASGSRNVITMILLLNLVLIHFVEFANKKRFSVLPALLLLIISIWMMGRSGIAVSSFYFVFIVYLRLSIFSTFQKYLIALAIFMILGVCVYLFRYEIEALYNVFFEGFYRKGTSYSEDPRGEMFSQYLSNMNFLTVLTGYDYTIDAFFQRYNNNPHNSFIRFHSHLGLFSLLFVCFLLYRMRAVFIENKWLFAAITVIAFRAWTDVLLFVGFYDFIFLVLFLCGIKLFQQRNRVLVGEI